MESFYGGRPGNPFILKGVKQEDQTFEFADLTDIQDAINNGNLKYGEYAIISPLEGLPTEAGKIYRVNETNQPIYMGRIAAPAINLSGDHSSGIEMVSPDPNVLNSRSKPTLNLITSPNDQTITVEVEVPWTEPNINTDLANGYNLTYQGNTEQTYYRPNIVIGTPPPVYMGYEESENYYRLYNFGNYLYPGTPSAIPESSIIFILEENLEAADDAENL